MGVGSGEGPATDGIGSGEAEAATFIAPRDAPQFAQKAASGEATARQFGH